MRPDFVDLGDARFLVNYRLLSAWTLIVGTPVGSTPSALRTFYLTEVAPRGHAGVSCTSHTTPQVTQLNRITVVINVSKPCSAPLY